MASNAACRSPRRIATFVFAVVVGLGAGVVAAAEPPIIVKKETRAGEAVLVRGFAEFDSRCRLKHVQRIVIANAPSHGTVETRPGNVVIGPNWVGAGHCEGTTLRGVQVFYVPGPDFTGTDRFSLDVGYSRGRTVRADVEVQVR
ncbi:MAG TPA: hypothetical protein VGO85_07460 [Caldimonas sp.]|jgi:hypothetical protein|nr:hypothetical protein [Caldimonas sp.]